MNLVDDKLPAFEIKTSIAEKTIYGMGEKSTSTSRLLLKNDLRFAINALEIHVQENFLVKFVKKLHAWCWFVKVHSADGREIWLNVGSLVKRLEITKEEAKQLENKPFAELMTRVEKHATSMTNAEEEIKKNNSFQNPSDLVKRAFPEEKIQLLCKKLLHKHFLSGELQTEQAIGGENFRSKLQDGRVYLIQMSRATTLGKGSFGTAYRVLDLTTGTFKVFKEFKPHEKNSVAQYCKASRYANPDNKWDNVALKPEVEFDDGYLTKEYRTSLDKWLKEPGRTIEEKMNACLQLARGLFQLSQENIFHGDIKPENVFIDEDQHGKPLVRCADLDCSRKNNEDNRDYIVYTPGYAHKPDTDKLTEMASDAFNAKKRAGAKVVHDPASALVYQTLLEKHDIFSIGISMYEVLTGNPSAFEIDPNTKAKTFNEKALEASLGRLSDEETKSIVSLIKRMVSFNHADRPAPAELARLSEAVFKPEIEDED